MLSKNMMTLMGMCLFLSSNGLWADNLQASDLENENKGKKPLVSVVSEITSPILYAPGTDIPKKPRLNRDELLKQATLRLKDSLSKPSKPVRLFVEEDEQSLTSDLGSFFAQYNRGDS
ncbi:MAG: hypothetical protein K2W94_03400 [Alphaproteobacteria bacterium]|nr:hypothetical protein [Alphaproteobacteria bacterium]